MTPSARDPQACTTDPVLPRSTPARQGLARLGLGLVLVMSLALSACGGEEDNSNCGSEGKTRELHCAP